MITDLPFKADSVEIVTGYSMIDTIPGFDIEQAMEEVFKILKPGGKLIHMLDLFPNFTYEMFIEQDNNTTLFPYFQKNFLGSYTQTGFYYIDISKFLNLIPILSPQFPFLIEYARNPLYAYQTMLNSIPSEIMVYLGQLFETLGIVKKIDKDFPKTIHQRLKQVAEKVGFQNVKVKKVTKEILLPIESIPTGSSGVIAHNLIYMNYGQVEPVIDQQLLRINPRTGKILATFYYFEATKPILNLETVVQKAS